MAFNTSFVSSESFTLPDEVLRKFKSGTFLSGIAPSKEQTRGAIEAALNVGADRASTREAQARQFALGQEQLDIRRQRNESLAAFEFEQIRGQERGLRSKAISGFAQFGTLALLLRGGTTSTTTKTATGSTTTTKPLSVLNIIKNLGDPTKWFS